MCREIETTPDSKQTTLLYDTVLETFISHQNKWQIFRMLALTQLQHFVF